MSFLKNIFDKKNQPIKNYNDFWRWFQNNEKVFFKVVKEKGNIEKDFFNKLSPQLNALKDGFNYLTGMYNDNTVELVFTADGVIKNIVFVEELVNAAPKIDGWVFTALKSALGIENVSIEMGEYKFSNENIDFYYNEFADFPDEIDITIIHKDLNEENKAAITNGTYIFLDNFLGELNFATTIDTLNVIGSDNVQQEIIPIEKLKDYLVWREKEFIEKYEDVGRNTGNDNYSVLEATLQSGNALVAIINTDLLVWDSKASHPWILTVELKYEGKSRNGMPDKDTSELMEKIEDEILNELKDFEGYLNIGRQTAENIREIYFACKDFRKPSKILHGIEKKYLDKIDLSYNIYKDKYWQSFDRYRIE
ncbi:MAG: DUF695 domain-containing protein [Chitinophagaceae bacterium]|nr:DUF695 domain-containing protein [Chitinophagaceae bacterium]